MQLIPIVSLPIKRCCSIAADVTILLKTTIKLVITLIITDEMVTKAIKIKAQL